MRKAIEQLFPHHSPDQQIALSIGFRERKNIRPRVPAMDR